MRCTLRGLLLREVRAEFGGARDVAPRAIPDTAVRNLDRVLLVRVARQRRSPRALILGATKVARRDVVGLRAGGTARESAACTACGGGRSCAPSRPSSSTLRRAQLVWRPAERRGESEGVQREHAVRSAVEGPRRGEITCRVAGKLGWSIPSSRPSSSTISARREHLPLSMGASTVRACVRASRVPGVSETLGRRSDRHGRGCAAARRLPARRLRRERPREKRLRTRSRRG